MNYLISVMLITLKDYSVIAHVGLLV